MLIKRKDLAYTEAYNRGFGFAIGASYNDGTILYQSVPFATAYADAFITNTEYLTMVEFAKDWWPSMKEWYLNG